MEFLGIVRLRVWINGAKNTGGILPFFDQNGYGELEKFPEIKWDKQSLFVAS
jgi:hypothetical protein